VEPEEEPVSKQVSKKLNLVNVNNPLCKTTTVKIVEPKCTEGVGNSAALLEAERSKGISPPTLEVKVKGK